MKKTIMILATMLGMTLAAKAQYFANADGRGGGLFGRGMVSDEQYYGAFSEQYGLLNNNGLPGIPGHDLGSDQPAPLGTGIFMLTALGTAYLCASRRKDKKAMS